MLFLRPAPEVDNHIDQVSLRPGMKMNSRQAIGPTTTHAVLRSNRSCQKPRRRAS
jgi:hypothetical protein